MVWVRKIQNKNGAKMITLPRVLIKEVGWQYGDNLDFTLLDNGIVCLEKIKVIKYGVKREN